MRSIYEIFGPYLETTLEQFEISFMRDVRSEDEDLIWAGITAAWLDYHNEYLGDERLPGDEEKKLISALIHISTGAEDVDMLGVPNKVGRNQGRRIKTSHLRAL